MAYLAVDVAVPDEEDARQLSRTLVEECIAAGTRVSSGMSHYRWEGSVRERSDWTVTAFTTADNLEALYDLLDERHPDDLPGVTYREIGARDEYLHWVEEQTS